jgi:hypothetical protein
MRAAIAAALVVFATVQPAQALTIRDVIELTRAGLTEDVLVALIEVDGGIYATDPATLKSLKEAGVSERVMIALIRSGRERRVEEPPPAPVVEEVQQQPPPPTVVIEHREVIEHRAPQVQQVAVPVPVYVPVYQTRGRSHPRQEFNGIQPSTFVPFQSGPPVVTPRPQPEPASPVYWGFGGKRRPDAWDPPPGHDRKHPDEGGKDKDRGRDDRPPKK